MIDQEKQSFWNMMNVCSELYKRPHMSKEAIMIWWAKLQKFEFNVVSKALDKWSDDNSHMPTPHDIILLCKPSQQPEFTHKLVNKIPDEIRQENRQKLQKMMQELGWRKSV